MPDVGMNRDGGMWVCTWRTGMEVCGYVHGQGWRYVGMYMENRDGGMWVCTWRISRGIWTEVLYGENWW